MNKQYIIIPIVMLAVLAAFSAPAMAQCYAPVITRADGTVTDGKVMAIEGSSGSSWSFNVPDGNVQYAIVHWRTWGGCNENPTATFDNGVGAPVTVNIPVCYQDSTKGCWRSAFTPGNHHYYWVVDVTPGGANILTVHGCTADHFYFVGAISNTDPEERTHDGYWWHNFGFTKVESYTTWFNGLIDTAANHSLWTVQSHNENTWIYFNGVQKHYQYGGSFYAMDVNPGEIDPDQTQNLTWVNINGDYPDFFPTMAVLAEKIGIAKPDLVVTNIEPETETMRPGIAYTVNATIKNQGNTGTGVAFKVSLVVDDDPNPPKVDNVGPLAASEDTTISFTNVNLGEGCHNFTVVADCDNNVDEVPYEGNNALSKDYQVGYVILVKSDSDFAALEADPGMPPGSVTYYSGNDTYLIQDLEITNCAGDGIYIEGVTSDFVIKNCMVENCKPDASGVFLNDVTKGTIKCCTLRNNEAYGIELGLVPFNSEDPKNINITCNTIYQNGVQYAKNGIDLIGADCTVKGNLIQNNAEYGIYVSGNNNKIYNNTIEDSGSYGIKLFESSGNYVYWNDFVDNNNEGVQGWDDRLTNHWNTATPVNYPYGCTIYTNNNGNYWSDHTSPDSDGDGIVDTSYTLDGGVGAMDNYPLTVPWRLCGDANRNGRANRADASLVRNHWSNPPAFPICNPWAADANCNGDINRADASLIRNHWGFGYSLKCCKDCYLC